MKLDDFMSYDEVEPVDQLHYQFCNVTLDREFLGQPKGARFEHVSINFDEGTASFGLEDGETIEVEFRLEAE